MKKIFAIALFILVTINLYCQGQYSNDLKFNDFSLMYGKISLSLQESYFDVFSKKNSEMFTNEKLVKYSKEKNRGSLFIIKEVILRGLIASFSYQKIEKLEITKTIIKTSRNISIGMTEADVIKAYGGNYSINQATNQLIYRMKSDNLLINSYNIIFEISNNVVTKITLLVDYDENKLLILEDFSITSTINNRMYHVMQDMLLVAREFPEKTVQKKTLDDREQYNIGNCVIYTYPKKSEIYEIIVKSDGWVTRRGIVVGDSKEKVLEAYGIYNGLTIVHKEGKESITYVFTDFGLEKVYGREFYPQYEALLLEFTIENNTVTEIKLSYSMMGD